MQLICLLLLIYSLMLDLHFKGLIFFTYKLKPIPEVGELSADFIYATLST